MLFSSLAAAVFPILCSQSYASPSEPISRPTAREWNSQQQPQPQPQSAAFADLPFSSSQASAARSVGSGTNVGAQLFQWPFSDIAKECKEFLGPNGYAFVQTSPVQGHVKHSFDNYDNQVPWYLMYQPLGYQIGNRLGTEEDFKDMVSTCRAAGVDVVVDVVLNHNAYVQEKDQGGFGGSYTPSSWSSAPFQESFPDAGLNASHFNDKSCNKNIPFGANLSNEDLWTCRLGRLVDINTSLPYVQSLIAAFLNKLLSYGVVGFRVDAAICIKPADWRAIYSQLTPTYYGGNAFITHELFVTLSNGTYGDYLKIARAINFQYGQSVGRAFRNLYGQTTDSLPAIIANLPIQDHQSTVILENHDKERDAEGNENNALSRINYGWNYKQASAFLLLYPFGVPVVHSGFQITYNGGTDDNREQPVSAPFDPTTGMIKTIPRPIKNNICSGGWVCQHRWSDVFPLVRVRNWINLALNSSASGGRPDIFSLGMGSNQVYWSVIGSAFVLINSAQGSQPYPDAYFSVSTTLPPGTYCNMVYGYASGNTCILWPGVVLNNNEKVLYVVDGGGKTTASVRNNDKSRVLVLYTGPDGFIPPLPPVSSSSPPPATATSATTTTVASSTSQQQPVPTNNQPISLFSFTVQADSTLLIIAAVKNIAYTKVVKVNYCDLSGSCGGSSNSFACLYNGRIGNSEYESWKCLSSGFPRGLQKFYLEYRVNNALYFDKSSNGDGYMVTIPASSSILSHLLEKRGGGIQSLFSTHGSGVVNDRDEESTVVSFSIAGIPTVFGQNLGVSGSLDMLGSGDPIKSLLLSPNCTKIPCTWTGSISTRSSLLSQMSWNVVMIQNSKVVSMQCAPSSLFTLTLLPSTFIFVNQGPANDNVYNGVRYINLDSVNLCST